MMTIVDKNITYIFYYFFDKCYMVIEFNSMEQIDLSTKKKKRHEFKQ